MVKYRQNSMHC